MIGFGSLVSIYPNRLMLFDSRRWTSLSFSAPPSTPTQHVPHAAERHCTGIGPSIQRGSFARHFCLSSTAAPEAISCSLKALYRAVASFSLKTTVHVLFMVLRNPKRP